MAKRGGMGGQNGQVNFQQAANDARGNMGDVGMGLPVENDYRGAMGGDAGGPLFNDYRQSAPESGDVYLTQFAKKV